MKRPRYFARLLYVSQQKELPLPNYLENLKFQKMILTH